MGQKATNTIEQIELLKSRGMILDYEESKIKEFLLDIGYYRLGFYWNPFEIDNEHNFKKGTRFSDIIKLYYLDVDLRNILTRYINRIEINFRTKLVYYVSNKYKESPTWFADCNVVESNIIEKLPDFYNDKFIRLNKPIKKHHNKYINDKYAPAWKTFEFLTFGQIYKIYSNLKDEELKNKIANVYHIRDYKLLDNFLKAIIRIRNICSHNGVLYDFNHPIGIYRIPNKYYRNKTQNNTNLNASFRLILFLLNKVSINRTKDLERKLKEKFFSISENFKVNKVLKNTINFDL